MKKLIFGLILILAACLALCTAEEEGGYTVAAENEFLRLEFNDETFEMRVTDLASGKTYDTKVMNDQQHTEERLPRDLHRQRIRGHHELHGL